MERIKAKGGNIGIFYGVGVGPGDPELMTVKSVRVLEKVPVIAVPRSAGTSKDGVSNALTVVKKAVALEGKEVMELLFPMTKDEAALRSSREAAASKIVERLKSGLEVAFITLGDPMLYSTFSYLVPFVKEKLPGAPVKVVSGVTSFSAAAASCVRPLAESGEKVLIVPASYSPEDLREWLTTFDTVVLMKVNKTMGKLVDLLIEAGLGEKAFFASRVGWADEEVITDIRSLKGREPDYFSMVIVKR